MSKLKAKNIILFLIGSILLLALVYTLEINQVGEGRARLSRQRERVKELGLAQQEALEKFSLVHMGKSLIQIQEELQLEQVKEFTLIRPQPNQFSLNEHLYEL